MKPRTFNSILHFNNERWAAYVLNMHVNGKKGADIIDENKIVEVKFNLIHPNKYNYIRWPVLSHQLDYNCYAWKKAYWALGTYTLNQNIENITTSDQYKLEEMVEERNLYLVNWNWMFQFPSHFESGKTKNSEWAHYLVFAKAQKIPKITKEIKVNGGKVIFTKGVQEKDFSISVCPTDICPRAITTTN